MAVQAQHTSNTFSLNVGNSIRVVAGCVYSDPVLSELTRDVSGSRKRSRGQDSSDAMNRDLPMIFQNEPPARVVDSTGASTSGRELLSPPALDLYSHIYQQNLEIDTIIRLQNERLQLGLEESRKRHCRDLMTILENQVVNRLVEKERELEMANRKNAELQEKIRQMSAENQIWYDVAKNNEAIVSSLKSSLEQVLLQNSVAIDAVNIEEGYGDSDDVRSCCFERVAAGRDVTATAAATATDCLL